MAVFHSVHPQTNSATPALVKLEEAVARLRTRSTNCDFETLERELHDVFVTAERELLSEELERLDIDLPSVMIDGRVHHRVLRSACTYTSAAGPVQVMRTLYRAGRSSSVVPMELRAGVVAGHWTPLAARQATWVVSHLTPGEGEGLFRELGNMSPSKSSVDRLPKQLSERWEGERERFEAVLREHSDVPAQAVTVSVSLDGVMTPMKDGERRAVRERQRAVGKRTKGPAGYREVGCATLSFHDGEGKRLSTIRMARMPQAKKATLKTILSAELERVLKVAFCAAYGENSTKACAQFEKYRHVLRDDEHGVDKVVRALAYLRKCHPRRQAIATELAYFRAHRDRMRYAKMGAMNLPIGSGVVEAACKTLVTQRMKRSGMRWRHDGGQAILTIRSLIQSERFDAGWKMLAQTYRAHVSTPKNVVPFSPRPVQ